MHVQKHACNACTMRAMYATMSAERKNLMADYVNVRIRKDTYEQLKLLAAGAPMTQFFEVMASRPFTSQDKVDAFHQKQIEKREAELAGEKLQDDNWRDDFEEVDLSNWVLKICPECCVDFVLTQNPKDACEHWVQGYRKQKDGTKALDWKNTATNRFVWEKYYDPIRQEYSDANYGYGA